MTRMGILAGTVAITVLGVVSPDDRRVNSDGAARQQAGSQQSEQQALHVRMMQMVQTHQAMMADMKQMDEKLDALVSRMNAASGQAKQDAMAETLTALVAQRRTTHEHMAQMGCRMMLHLMHHTSGGDAPQMHDEMMANCVGGAGGGR